MFHPDEEALAALALGEDAGLTPGQLDHVRSCAECSATVESVAHTVALVRTGSRTEPMVAPPPAVWSRVEAAIDAAAVAPATVSPAARRLESVPSAGPRRAPRRVPLGWGAGLAAAGIAIGLLTGRALWQEPAAPAVTTIATARLDTLDTQQRLGDAALVRDAQGVDLRVATATLDPGDGYLEVWLINTDGKRMVSVGVLRGDGPETFPVSQTLIDEGYVIVDISREGFDDRPEHSGDSVARGTLPA
jgi:hypothetical protein